MVPVPVNELSVAVSVLPEPARLSVADRLVVLTPWVNATLVAGSVGPVPFGLFWADHESVCVPV